MMMAKCQQLCFEPACVITGLIKQSTANKVWIVLQSECFSSTPVKYMLTSVEAGYVFDWGAF